MAKRKPKNPHAVALGSNGGKKRAKKMTKEQRRASALHAITIRWDRERAKAAKEGVA
jgi:hypothetical protein